MDVGTQQSVKFTQLGCTILTTLLANPDGVRYLMEDKLLPQIADCLVQLDPVSCWPVSLDVRGFADGGVREDSWRGRNRSMSCCRRTGWNARSRRATLRCWAR